MGGVFILRILIGLGIFLCLLSPSVLATVTITQAAPVNTLSQVNLGSINNPVLRITVSGNGTATDDFTSIAIQNTGAVPFGVNFIKKITLVLDANANGVYDDVANVGSISFATNGISQTVQFSIALQSNLTTQSYFVLYDIDQAALASSTTDLTAQVNLAFLISNGVQVNSGSGATITIKQSGIVIDSTLSGTIVPSTLISAGLLDVPIAKVRVKAVGVSVTLNSVTINNSFGTFSPSTALIESGIKQIKIFADNVSDNQFFDGSAVDPLVGSKVVQSGIGDTVSDVGIFLSTPVFIPTDSAKTFYIMYSFGNAMTVGAQASVLIQNMTGSNPLFTGGLTLSGTLPVALSANATVAAYNLKLNGSNSYNLGGLSAIPAQKNIKVLDFNLSNTSGAALNNVVVQISNPYGSFASDGQGINRVTIYEQKTTIPTADLLIGSTVTFVNNSTAQISGISLPANSSANYYVAYDVGDLAPAGQSFAAQLSNISGTGVNFSGVVPAPNTFSTTTVDAKALVVLSVTTNLTQIDPTQTPQISITIQNQHSTFAIAAAQINQIVPCFYVSNIQGSDVSFEYNVPTITPVNFPVGSTQVFTFTVSPNTAIDLTNGVIKLDALVDYVHPLAASTTHIQTTRYIGPGNVYYPAAQVQGGQWVMSGGTTTTYANKFPSFINYVEIDQQGLGTTIVPFLNNDYVKSQSKMMIHFKSGAAVDIASLQLLLNNTALVSNTDYLNDGSGTVTINSLGTSTGILTLKLKDTAGVQMADTKISFRMSDNNVISNLLAGPSPYKARIAGNLNVEFQSSQAGLEAKFLVINAAGNIVYENKVNTVVGNNLITWNGNTSNGSKISPGMYLLRVIAKSGGKNIVIKSKLGVQ